MRRAGVVASLALIVACEVTPVASPSASPTTAAIPTATAAPTARGNASPSGSPTPEPAARPGIRATPAGTLPESFRYVTLDIAIADGFRTRLWLVDLNAKRPPSVVAEWEGPASPVGGYSISADGRTAIVSATGSRSRVALYLLRPETGESRVLFEEPGSIVISPRITPDGQRSAFTKYPADGGSDLGLWSGLIAGGELRQIAERSTASNVPLMPLAWSTDPVWLAFTRELADRTEVRLAHREGGAETVIGPGDKVSWRRNPPELLIAVSTSPASRAYTYDLVTRKVVEVVKGREAPDPRRAVAPSARPLRVRGVRGGGPRGVGRYVDPERRRHRRLASRPRAFGVRPPVVARWHLLTGLGGGDDAIVPVVELLSGRRIAVLCRRGGTPPADCV